MLDIGGSFIKSALTDGSGALEDRRTTPIPTSYEDLLRAVAKLAASGPAAVICAIPGVYNKDIGVPVLFDICKTKCTFFTLFLIVYIN